MYAGQQVVCPSCGAGLVIGQESLGIGQGDERPTSNIEHGTSNEEPDDLRTIVQNLWEPTIRDGDLPEMTLKGESLRRGGASQDDSISDVIKVRPKEIAHKGATPEVPEYEILRLLGEGGMGMVYQARQTAIDRSIAIKMVKPEAAKDRDECHQFLAEAVATGDLDHPNIVPIYDLGMNDAGALFYAMKEVKGTSWKDVIYEKSLNANLDILMRTADAVAFAHSRGVIHRDLKPENVMLGDFGEVLLMDWGLAAAVTEEAKADKLDPEHAIGGTPTYMAPEMAVGDVSKIGTRSDVYLLGAILYEIITDGRPHTGTDVMDCLANAAANIIQPLGEAGEPTPALGDSRHPSQEGMGGQRGDTLLGGGGTDELLDIALKAMATEPEGRYESVKSFQAAVREYQKHEESIALAARAREGLVSAKAKKDYEGFAYSVFQLKEALTLWPENEAAPVSLSEGKREYAECALKCGDLDLAASILDGGDESHRALGKEIRAAKKERDARKKRVIILKLAAVAATIMCVVVFGVAFFWVRSERNVARENLAAFKTEQARRRAEAKKAAPVFLEMADRAAGEDDLDTALLAATTAVDGDRELLSARLYRAGVYICRDEFRLAQADLEVCLKKAPANASAQLLTGLRERALKGKTPQVRAGLYQAFLAMRSPGLAVHVAPSVDEQIELYRSRIAGAWPGAEKRLWKIADGMWGLDLSDRADVSDLSPLKGMLLSALYLRSARVGDLSPLKGMPLTALSLQNCREVSDLAPLEGMPLSDLILVATNVRDLSALKGMLLTRLSIDNTRISDLTALKGMPLIRLYAPSSQVSDLAPLKGMPLMELNLFRTPVSDLSPLHGMPLTILRLGSSRVSDLSPLKGMSLTELDLTLSLGVRDLSPLKGAQLTALRFSARNITNGVDTIRNMTSLKAINGLAAAEFWAQYDTGELE